MAIMRTSIIGNETQGEKLLYYRFRDKLSDDYHVWHNIYLADAGTEVDFIVLHPAEGIYVLEVKDWVAEKIESANAQRVFIDKNGRTENLQNPVLQARNNSFKIRNGLVKDARMVQTEGDHMGQLVVPVCFGAVLSNITIREIQNKRLEVFFPLNKILDKEFVKGQLYSDQDIENSLRELREVIFSPLLEDLQWNAINTYLGTPEVSDTVSKEPIGVFDDNQEKLVTFKSGKNILIEGPAGSGKSLVLIQRALYIQKTHPDWRIGIFCFNVVMSAYLQTLLEQENKGHNMVVSYFNGISDLGLKPKSLDAVLIDEGQDIKEADFRKIVPLLSGSDSPVTIFYDPRQSIYSVQNIPALIEKYGIIIDNEKELVRQQRSVHVLVALAFHTAYSQSDKLMEEVIEDVKKTSDRFFQGYDNPVSALSKGVSRHFSDISVSHPIKNEIQKGFFMRGKRNFTEMMEDVVEVIEKKVESGEADYRDFMIIYPTKNIGRDFLPSKTKWFLSEKGIPFRVIHKKYGAYFCPEKTESAIINENDNRNIADFESDVVNVYTVHHAKGLDAKYLFILGFDNIEKFIDNTLTNTLFDGQNKDEVNSKVADMGYVALTRTRKECYVYYTKNSRSRTKRCISILRKVINDL